jgi:hypothetical protein
MVERNLLIAISVLSGFVGHFMQQHLIVYSFEIEFNFIFRSSDKMETVSVVIKMEKEEETEDGEKCLIPVSCEEIIKLERQEKLNHIGICP